MATKNKSAPKADPTKKLLITAIKKTIVTNSVLPILEDVYLTGDEVIMTDLESTVIIPFKTPEMDVCVPADKFIDCLDMMDKPEFEFVTTEIPIPIPLHFRLGDKIYRDAEVDAKIRYQSYLNGFTNEDEEKPKSFNEWCEIHINNYQEEDVAQKPPIISHHFEAREGKKKIKLGYDSPEDFPRLGLDEMFEVGNWTAKEIGHLKDSLCFVSKDDLRPAMTGVFCNDHIAATDAYRLAFFDIEPVLEKFIIPAKAVKILLALGFEDWKLFAQMKESGEGDKKVTSVTNVVFLHESGVMLMTRAIDARFPDYKVVIPLKKDIAATVLVDKELLMKELKNAGKFANKSTNQVLFHLNGKIEVHAEDIDFNYSYHNDVEGKVKFRVKEGDQPAPINIAFNGVMLSEILHKQPKDEKVSIAVWGPTKAAIINDNYLLMPLMLNS